MDGGKWRRGRRRENAKETVEIHTGAFKKSRTEMTEIQSRHHNKKCLHERQSKRKIMKTNENQFSQLDATGGKKDIIPNCSITAVTTNSTPEVILETTQK